MDTSEIFKKANSTKNSILIFSNTKLEEDNLKLLKILLFRFFLVFFFLNNNLIVLNLISKK